MSVCEQWEEPALIKYELRALSRSPVGVGGLNNGVRFAVSHSDGSGFQRLAALLRVGVAVTAPGAALVWCGSTNGHKLAITTLLLFPKWSTMACPAEAGTTAKERTGGPATDIWLAEHVHPDWIGAPGQGLRAKCDKDECPPAYLFEGTGPDYVQGGRRRDAQLVRFLPNGRTEELEVCGEGPASMGPWTKRWRVRSLREPNSFLL